jgi:hypothetical protein
MHLIQNLLLLCLFLFPLAGQASTPSKKIYICPGYWGDIFAIDNPLFNRDDCLRPLCDFRDAAATAGYQVEQTYHLDQLGDFEYLIVFEVFPEQNETLKKYPKEKLVLCLWEPPSVLPNNYNAKYHSNFSRVYTWRDDLVDNVTYFKFQYPVMHPMIAEITPFDCKRLCTLVACNKNSSHPHELYSERKKLIAFFEYNDKANFDLYGKWWPDSYKTFRGAIDKKVDVLKDYRFCFAFENVKGVPGYITEKIFDCFHAGCVPVYWGAPNISSYIPKGCYISREDFATNKEMYDFLRQMKEPEYNQYLANIRRFLEGPGAYPFSGQAFVDTMMDLIQRRPE